MTQLGELSLWIALLMAAWCVTLSVQGALMRRPSLTGSGARGLYMSFCFTALAAAGLMTAFLGGDYSVRYVATHAGSNVEAVYRMCAFWAGGAGELLLASLMLGGTGSVAALTARRRDTDRARSAWTVAALGVAVAAALAATVFGANPFARLPRTAGDGRGLDPVLRHPLMTIQPPLMLLGVACAVVPLALLASAVVRRRFDRAHIARLHASAVAAWVVLSAALLAGARWSYESPGLRPLSRGGPALIAGGAAWGTLTLALVAMEVRPAAGAQHSEADLMRRRAGRLLAACGALLCCAALAARPLGKNYDVQLRDGERYRATDAWGHEWTFTSQGASRLERPGDDVTAVALLPTRDGARQPFIASESRQYYTVGGLDVYPPEAVPGIHSSIAQDLFVVLSDAGEGSAVLRISFKPLVELEWGGGVLLALGGLLVFWPPRADFAS